MGGCWSASFLTAKSAKRLLVEQTLRTRALPDFNQDMCSIKDMMP